MDEQAACAGAFPHPLSSFTIETLHRTGLPPPHPSPLRTSEDVSLTLPSPGGRGTLCLLERDLISAGREQKRGASRISVKLDRVP
jgi:hypothetical protein